jgi:1-deoxyxylulose-5-phosphate synthase
MLGPSGVNVSKICLGTATFGVAPDAQEAGRVVHAALDLGINFFDTANVYGATPTFDRPGAPPASERGTRRTTARPRPPRPTRRRCDRHQVR